MRFDSSGMSSSTSSPPSTHALPPAGVLMKLQEPDASAAARRNRRNNGRGSYGGGGHSGPRPRAVTIAAGGGSRRYSSEDNNSLDVEDRKRAFSTSAETVDRDKNQQQQQQQIPRMFCLDSTISPATERLERICQDLHAAGEELGAHAGDLRRQISNSSSGVMSSGSNSSIDENSSGDDDSYATNLESVCRCANADLKLASIALVEFHSLMVDVNIALASDRKDLAWRAGWLSRESEASFEKMKPEALIKMRRRIAEEEEEENSSY